MSELKIPGDGLGVEWFAAATRALGRIHGPRMTAPEPAANRFFAALAEAEAAYRELAAEEKPKRRRTGP